MTPLNGPRVSPTAPARFDRTDEPADDSKPNAFDHAVSMHALGEAAEEYALRHGQPGSAAYVAAWARFRQQVKSIDDLHRLRTKTLRTATQP